MIKDIISNTLTRLRNSSLALYKYSIINYSKINISILNILQDEGYIDYYYFFFNKDNKLNIKVILKYIGWWIKKPLILKIIRISKPSKRIYSNYINFYKYFNNFKFNYGLFIISTSQGLMSHSKAINLKKGGEILFYIE
jgi:small subunit ribosomal protein S8